MDEEVIKSISEVYEYQVNLAKRKEDVIRLIDEKGLLTDELKDEIMKASKLVEVEDLYRPFKQKKRTRATIAKEKGLEGLANIIRLQQTKKSIEEEAKAYINAEKEVNTVEEAILVT